MRHYHAKSNVRNRGFTLIELLISIAIIVILAVVTFGMFSGARNSNDVNGMARQIAAILRQAQQQSMNDYQGSAWGVRFSNAAGTPSTTFYALFAGSYSTSSIVGYYRLPSTVAFITSTLPSGSVRDVIFAAVSGVTTSTSIGVYSLNSASISSTIVIASSGVVSY